MVHAPTCMTRTIIIVLTAAVLAGGLWYFNRGGEAPGRPRSFGPVLVVTEPVTRHLLVTSVEALGTTRANESVTLTANLTDTIRRINFEDGDYVKKGTVLVELTNEEEEAQLAEARANLDEAQRVLKRLIDLDERGIAAASDVDEARSLSAAAQARLDTIVARLQDRMIRAPFNGVLGFRNVSPGTLLMPGDSITTLDDVSLIKVDFTVPETALSIMQPESRIIAQSVGTGERLFEGTVRAVGSRVDPVTRAVVVRALIDNQDRALRPGMLLTIQVVTEEKTALAVPERAIVQKGERKMVYVIDDEQHAMPRPVELGIYQSGIVEIISGLAEDEVIVTEGVIKMRPGVEVRSSGADDQRQLAGRDGKHPGSEKDKQR
jgi:membrane fusion protein (multidrug efflux system)